VKNGSTVEFSADSSGNAIAATSVQTGTAPACTAGTAGALCLTEGTAPTNASGATAIYADSTYHGPKTAVNGGSTFGQITYAPCTTSQKSETGADATLLSCTPLSVAGTYRISLVMSFSAANTATIGWTATWTDSNGNAQTPTNLSLFQEGTAAPALTFTTSAAGNYYGSAIVDINNAGTAIVVKTTFSGTSMAAKVTAIIERIG
jgi:hypothetical protein